MLTNTSNRGRDARICASLRSKSTQTFQKVSPETGLLRRRDCIVGRATQVSASRCERREKTVIRDPKNTPAAKNESSTWYDYIDYTIVRDKGLTGQSSSALGQDAAWPYHSAPETPSAKFGLSRREHIDCSTLYSIQYTVYALNQSWELTLWTKVENWRSESKWRIDNLNQSGELTLRTKVEKWVITEKAPQKKKKKKISGMMNLHVRYIPNRPRKRARNCPTHINEKNKINRELSLAQSPARRPELKFLRSGLHVTGSVCFHQMSVDQVTGERGRSYD